MANDIARVRLDWVQLTQLKEQLEVNLHTLRNTQTYQKDKEYIAEFMKETAKNFIIKNGSVRTTKMLNSMEAEANSQGIKLWNSAIGKDGYPYPRSIEYGFNHYKGVTVPAKPFLRPTLRLASELSKNRFENTMLSVLRGRSLNAQGRRATLGFGSNLRSNSGQQTQAQNKMMRGSDSSWFGKSGSSSWNVSQKSPWGF